MQNHHLFVDTKCFIFCYIMQQHSFLSVSYCKCYFWPTFYKSNHKIRAAHISAAAGKCQNKTLHQQGHKRVNFPLLHALTAKSNLSLRPLTLMPRSPSVCLSLVTDTVAKNYRQADLFNDVRRHRFEGSRKRTILTVRVETRGGDGLHTHTHAHTPCPVSQCVVLVF